MDMITAKDIIEKNFKQIHLNCTSHSSDLVCIMLGVQSYMADFDYEDYQQCASLQKKGGMVGEFNRMLDEAGVPDLASESDMELDSDSAPEFDSDSVTDDDADIDADSDREATPEQKKLARRFVIEGYMFGKQFFSFAPDFLAGCSDADLESDINFNFNIDANACQEAVKYLDEVAQDKQDDEYHILQAKCNAVLGVVMIEPEGRFADKYLTKGLSHLNGIKPEIREQSIYDILSVLNRYHNYQYLTNQERGIAEQSVKDFSVFSPKPEVSNVIEAQQQLQPVATNSSRVFQI